MSKVSSDGHFARALRIAGYNWPLYAAAGLGIAVGVTLAFIPGVPIFVRWAGAIGAGIAAWYAAASFLAFHWMFDRSQLLSGQWLKQDFAEAPARVVERFDVVDLTGTLDEIWSLVRRLNAFVQEEQPWQLAKDDAQAGRLDAALYALAEGLRVVSLLLVPFMPEATDKLLAALGHEDRSLEAARFGSVGGGNRCEELEPLFPRVEAAASA